MKPIQEKQIESKAFVAFMNLRQNYGPVLSRNLYLCGPTTYESVHIGNLRTLFFFDIYAKFNRYLFRSIKTCMNLTDIDDKIISRALDKGKGVLETSRYFSHLCLDSMKYLNLQFDFTPRVTDFIGEMIGYISRLQELDKAYVGDNGDILCRIDTELYNQLQCHGFASKHEQDFTLWKKTSTLPYWSSPFGKGRPGWHLECVVMSSETMGSIDDHFGGTDLLFPHHKNEEYIFSLLNHKPIKWMHFGLLQDEHGQKMSKRLKNTIDIGDIPDIDALKIFYLNNNPHAASTFSISIFNTFLVKKNTLIKNLNSCSYDPISPDDLEKFIKELKILLDYMNEFKVVCAFTHLFRMIKIFKCEKNIYLSILRDAFGFSCF